MKHNRRGNTVKPTLCDCLPIFVYCTTAIFVLWHLLLQGYILTLDMHTISHINIKINISESIWWLARPSLNFLLKGVSLLIPTWILQKIILFLIFFLAGFSAHKLSPAKSKAGKYFTGLLYMLNPFVYVRFMVGHWLILLAYAVTPLAIKAMIDLFEEQRPINAIKAALLLTLVAVFSAHILLLTLFVFLIFLLVKIIRFKKPIQLLRNIGVVLGLFFLLNFYWLMPSLTEKTIITGFGYQDLLTFMSRTWGTGFNIFFSLATLHGFWRPPEDYYYISEVLPFWYLIYVFILFLAIHGFTTKHNDEKMGVYVKGFALVAVISLILATGISTPYFSKFFELLFHNLFFFKGFREPQKFVMLIALAYAYLGGLGLNELHKKLESQRKKTIDRKRVKVILLVVAVFSPFLYGANMLFGFNGQLKTVDYPEEWYEVNMFLNSQEGNFNALFFPWHGYMKFSWTDRIIMNPARGFFDRPVIQGENIEVGPIETQSPKPTQYYIHFLLNHRDKIKNFGELVAPLNVKYIILAKEVDYKEYGFLYNQRDLKVVLDNRKMIVFESQYKTAKIYWVKDLTRINGWKDILKGPLPEPVPLNYVQLSPVEYEVEVLFNNGYVILTGSYDEGWRLNGEKPAPNLGLTNAFYVEKPGTYKIYFQKFNILLTYYLISLATFIACITLYTHSYLKSKYDMAVKNDRC